MMLPSSKTLNPVIEALLRTYRNGLPWLKSMSSAGIAVCVATELNNVNPPVRDIENEDIVPP